MTQFAHGKVYRWNDQAGCYDVGGGSVKSIYGWILSIDEVMRFVAIYP